LEPLQHNASQDSRRAICALGALGGLGVLGATLFNLLIDYQMHTSTIAKILEKKPLPTLSLSGLILVLSLDNTSYRPK